MSEDSTAHAGARSQVLSVIYRQNLMPGGDERPYMARIVEQMNKERENMAHRAVVEMAVAEMAPGSVYIVKVLAPARVGDEEQEEQMWAQRIEMMRLVE